MAKLDFDLNRFKKTAHNEHQTTLRHDEGHEVKINHKTVDPGTVKMLKDLPHFDEGGGVSSQMSDDQKSQLDQSQPQQPQAAPPPVNININASPQPQQQEPQGAQDVLNKWRDRLSFIPHGPAIPAEAETQALQKMGYDPASFQPQQPQTQVQPQAQQPGPASLAPQPAGQPQQQDPYGVDAYNNAVVGGLNQQKAGIAGEAATKGALGETQAGLLDTQATQKQQQFKDFQTASAPLLEERQKWINDLQNQHVNPDHYINNMSTGKHITTAIGLILGGIGGGLTGQENPVLKSLNMAINRDLEAQQTDIGTKKTLLESNFKQYGDMRTAYDMSQVMMNDVTAIKLKAEAERSQKPLAKYWAEQTIGQLNNQSASVLQNAQMRKYMLSGQNAQGGSGINPAVAVKALIQDPKQQEEAMKELERTQQLETLRADLHNTNDQLRNKTLTGSLQPHFREGKINTFAGVLGKVATNRYNQQEAQNQIASFLANPGDVGSTAKSLDENIDNFIDAERGTTPRLTSVGINVPKKGRIKESAPKL